MSAHVKIMKEEEQNCNHCFTDTQSMFTLSEVVLTKSVAKLTRVGPAVLCLVSLNLLSPAALARRHESIKGIGVVHMISSSSDFKDTLC